MTSTLSLRNVLSQIRPLTIPLFACSVSLVLSAIAMGQSIELADPPMAIESGKTVTVKAKYDLPVKGIVQVQLMASDWSKVGEQWKELAAGAGECELEIAVPADEKSGAFIWQAILYDASWKKLKDQTITDVTAGSSPGAGAEPAMPETKPDVETKPIETQPQANTTGETKPAGTASAASGSATADDGTWLPPGNWTIDWSDEFEGEGELDKWFPMLGYNPDEFKKRTEKALRWSGKTADSAWMYSTKEGNHWLDGEGNLVLQIVAKKNESNENGPKVEAAYLLSGYPEAWDSTGPGNARWAGKFVTPKDGPLYICSRFKSDQVKGHSTWFAFWLFSETRAYNKNPVDGSEVDIIEIAKGAPNYMNTSFNVAQHWGHAGTGSSESKQFNSASTPKSLDFVNVNDEEYHTYGLEWTQEYMKCYVDGKLFYTFTENIPSDPVDMMLLLTLEFKLNAWDPHQGDGRTTGPFVSENDDERVMSQATVDFVRVYKQE